MERKIYDINAVWEIFEQLLSDNEDVLRRLKEKNIYTVEDFLNSWKSNKT